MKPLSKVYLVYEGTIRGFNNAYYNLPYRVRTLSPTNTFIDDKTVSPGGGYPVQQKKLVNPYFELFKWEEERIPIHAHLRAKLDLIIDPDVTVDYVPAEDNFVELLFDNSVAIPDRLHCEMALIPVSYHLYTNSHNIFQDLDFYPSTECSLEIFSGSIADLNLKSNDSYFDGNVEKANSTYDTGKFYQDSNYQLDYRKYTITDDASLNGYSRVRVVPHPELPLETGKKYVLRMDALKDERDEGWIFTQPKRLMITSGLYTSNTLQFGNNHELRVKGPKVPFFHLDFSNINARRETLAFLACEFYEKIQFSTSDYLQSKYDKIIINFDTSTDQFFTDLGIKGFLTFSLSFEYVSSISLWNTTDV